MQEVLLDFPKTLPLGSEVRVFWKAALMQLVQDALAVFSEAVDIGKDYHHWITDQTLLAVVRDLVNKVMYLKGIKICLRPTVKASPQPQLSIHTAPLRVQIHGTVKLWTMDDMQDLSTCSHRPIEESTKIDAWQIVWQRT